MRQVFHNLCTYSADLYGVNSALYELGGLIVMHDASGCNSTYTTHDEPRWYTMDSMVYVSGLNERDAILGNDERLITDVTDVAFREHPKFIALNRSVLPAYMAVDLRGIARIIEKRTGIPTFGFLTNGMDTYIRGVGMAFEALAKRFVQKPAAGRPEHDGLSVNLIGVTPLDFSINGNAEKLEESVREMGYTVQSNWAMGSTLEEIAAAAEADVSLVVSAGGLPAAQYLYEAFGIPYVIGFSCGKDSFEALRTLLRRAADEHSCFNLYQDDIRTKAVYNTPVIIIGEAVHASAIRYRMEAEQGYKNIRIICPLEEDAGILRADDYRCIDEDTTAEILNHAELVIADPVYRRVCREDLEFVDDPHEAYSGRMYHDKRRVFVGL